MRGLPRILSLFATNLKKKQYYKSTNVRFYLSYDIMITIEILFLALKRHNFAIIYATMLWTS